MTNKKVVDKFKVIVKSREKGKVGTGTIEMNLRFDLPYEQIAPLLGFLNQFKKK